MSSKDLQHFSIRTASPLSVRLVNRSIVLRLIRRSQPISRAELARKTGFFRSSISDIVDELIAEELVIEQPGVALRRGRVPASLWLKNESYPVLGLIIRPEYCQIAAAGLSGGIQHSLAFATPRNPRQLVKEVKRTSLQVTRDAGIHSLSNVRRIGVSIPGHVDAPSGRILWTPTHPELTDFAICAEIRSSLGIDAIADNDCNVGALSELWAASEEQSNRSHDFVFLNISDYGAGGGAILDGQLYSGHDGHFCAEFGHMIIDPSGPPCGCGRRGCWELFVSNSSTWKRYHPTRQFSPEGFEDLMAMAAKGSTKAFEALKVTARYLSLGISNIGFALNPAEVVVAGRITRLWGQISAIISEEYGSPRLKCVIRPARLSADDSLLHGAVCLALREVYAAPRFGEVKNL